MTPEERFTKIENAIQSLTETQARHDTQIEKQNAGIRDLIVVSRAFLESQKEVTAQIRELGETQREAQRTTDEKLRRLQEAAAEQQRITEEKLHALIDTVDRIIRSQKS